MEKHPWIPEYPGVTEEARTEPLLRQMLEVFAPPLLEDPAAETLAKLEQITRNTNLRILHHKRPPQDPNIYIGVGTEVPQVILEEFLKSLSRPLAFLHIRVNEKHRPLWIYVYDLEHIESSFCLPDQLEASLNYFAQRRQGARSSI